MTAPSIPHRPRLASDSLARTRGLHADLVRVLNRALTLSPVPFIVSEGMRSAHRQERLVDAKQSSRDPNRHLDGHAVDLATPVNGRVVWNLELYEQLAQAVKAAARECNVPLEWGGDRSAFRDPAHYQLPWGPYPAKK